MKAATAEQMKRLDKRAIEERGIPSVVLMERAAGFVAEEVLALLSENKAEAGFRGREKSSDGNKPPRAAVFCGPGNNGGAGVGAARFLRKQGIEVRAFLVGKREKMTADTREMERRLRELGGCLEGWDGSEEQAAWCEQANVLVDAVLGIGLHNEVREETAKVLAFMDSLLVPVVAADLASGIEADTGRVLGAAVHADRTVTFTCPKPGHYVGQGALYAGKIRVCDIGIPDDLLEEETLRTEIVDQKLAASWLPVRPADGHKGTFGKVYAVGGSVGLTGAPVFAARAAARTGSGLVFLGVPEEIYPITAGMCMEVMPSPLPGRNGRIFAEAYFQILERLKASDAGLIGPGLGRSTELVTLVCRLLKQTDTPLVLDADALYAIKDRKNVLKERAEKGYTTILTPHEGEFAYLGGDLSEGREEAARRFSAEYGCILVLKGPGSITARPDGSTYVNTTGNNGMAKGGSGDVLSGMILSFLGQGLEPAKAAALAVWLHGFAGDLCREELGEFGMLPTDCVERIPAAIRELQKRKQPAI